MAPGICCNCRCSKYEMNFAQRCPYKGKNCMQLVNTAILCKGWSLFTRWGVGGLGAKKSHPNQIGGGVQPQ